jgi:nitrite reductase/ring-hydroxylating ferredoxin subunit
MDATDETSAVDLSQHPTNDALTGEPRTRWILTDTLVPPPGESTRVLVEGKAVAVFNVGGRLYGLASECGHRGAPLEQGSVKDGVVSCKKHGAQFRMDSGTVVGGNIFVRRSTRPVRTYTVQRRGAKLAIGVSPFEEGQ